MFHRPLEQQPGPQPWLELQGQCRGLQHFLTCLFFSAKPQGHFPRALGSKRHPDYNDHITPMWPKTGEMWVISDFTHILRDPQLWWVLKEEGKLPMHLKDSKECSLAAWWSCSCFLSSLLLLLLCFSPEFHHLLPCLSLLFLQLLRDPAANPVFSPTTYPTGLCLPPAVPCAAASGVLLTGAAGLVPGHSNHLHITCCWWLLVLGTSVSVLLTVQGQSEPRPEGKVHHLCSLGSAPHKLPPKSPAQRMCLCSASEKTLSRPMMENVSCLSAWKIWAHWNFVLFRK